jgi:hypothetical protein
MTLVEIVTHEVKDPIVSFHILMRMKYDSNTCQYIARSDNGDILMTVADELITEEKHL